MDVQKLWDISEGQPNVVPVQDMLIQNDSCFYVLRYPLATLGQLLVGACLPQTLLERVRQTGI